MHNPNPPGSVLSLQILGPKTPAALVVFGSGAQAEAHIRAFVAAYPSLRSVVIVARKATPRSAALVAEMGAALPGVAVSQGVASFASGTADNFDLSAAVAAADIICTMTSSTEPLFASADVKAGAHVCMIGSYKPHMREVEDALIRRAGVVVVDSREACGHEAGELQNSKDEDLVEIGQLVNGDAAALDKVLKTGDVTVFKSVGLGVQDVAITAVVLAEAEKMGLGVEVPGYD
jgi:ornithine cyclodeaminase